MRTLVRHALLPCLAPAVIVGLYFTPVSAIGCANRGLLALAVVLGSLAVGVACGVNALRFRRDSPESSSWWALSSAILAIPAALVLGPLG